MPKNYPPTIAVKLSRHDQQLLRELVTFIPAGEDDQPATMSSAVRLSIKALHRTMKARVAREAHQRKPLH